MSTATTSSTSGSPENSDKGTDKKFDLDKVNVEELPEEYRSIVKSFQADYSRKTQALSEKEKTLQEQEALIQKGKDWDEWYRRNENTIQSYNEYARKIAEGGNVHIDNRGKDDDLSLDDNDDDDLEHGDVKKTRNEFKKEIGSLRNELTQQKADTSKTVDGYADALVDLMDIIQDNDYGIKIKPKKVLEYARKEGITDMKRALEGAYGTEIRDAEVERLVKEKLEKEREKLALDVVNDTQPTGRKPLKLLNRGDKK